MKYTEEYITNNADTFDWEDFECEQTIYSEFFMDRFKDKIITYILNGKAHSYKDRPSIIGDFGTKCWYKNGIKHRDNDLPAIIMTDGTKRWLKNGKYHRDNDLPAIIHENGYKRWFKNGFEYFPNKQ